MCDQPNGVTSVPPGFDVEPVQLTLRFEVIREERGGTRVYLSAPEASELLAKYGSAGRALAQIRDVIVSELDFAVEAFGHRD